MGDQRIHLQDELASYRSCIGLEKAENPGMSPTQTFAINSHMHQIIENTYE